MLKQFALNQNKVYFNASRKRKCFIRTSTPNAYFGRISVGDTNFISAPMSSRPLPPPNKKTLLLDPSLTCSLFTLQKWTVSDGMQPFGIIILVFVSLMWIWQLEYQLLDSVWQYANVSWFTTYIWCIIACSHWQLNYIKFIKCAKILDQLSYTTLERWLP